MVQRVMFCEGLSHHPCKSYSNTKFLLLLLSLLVFHFFAAANPVISSLFRWFHLLLCAFLHMAMEERIYFPKPNLKYNYCIDLLIFNSSLPQWGPAL